MAGSPPPNSPSSVEDLILALERKLHELALGHVDDLVVALGGGLAFEDHVPGLLLERRLLLGECAGEVVALVCRGYLPCLSARRR